MIKYEGEQYVTATEVVKRFKISRGTCYNNVLRHMQGYYLPGRKNALYKLSDVEQLSQVRIVEKKCRNAKTVRPNVMIARQAI